MSDDMQKQAIIIAEAGVNHNGSLELAKKLVHVAAKAGADYVKFQSFHAAEIVTETAAKAKYQETTTQSETQFQMLKNLELNLDAHKILLSECRIAGIKFLSTGFDIQTIDMLLRLGIDLIKIPSGEITNFQYLKHVGGLGKPIILSTGMCNLADIKAALEVLEGAGASRNQITILHCTTNYPAGPEEVNLRAMITIKNEFACAVGYSDHTLGSEISLGAIAMGATVIEKHFTLDKELPGPDHSASLNPEELQNFVRQIRNLELGLGSTEKKATSSEVENMKVARRSLVASKSIKKGEAFSEDNLKAKRPGTGVSPMQLPMMIGMLAQRSYNPDELIDP